MTTDRLMTRPFLVVTTATCAFFVFVGMLQPVLPVFVEQALGGGGVAIGAQVAAFSLAAIAIRPVIGPLGDRVGRRWLMIVGAIIAAITSWALVVVESIPRLLLLRAGTGIGEAALFVGAATLIADLAPAHRRAEAASYFSVAIFAGLGLGPVLAEVVLADNRFDRTFLLAAAFAVLCAVIAIAAPTGRGVTPDNQVVVSWSGCRRWVHPVAFAPGVVLASGLAAITVYFIFVPTYVDELGMSGSGRLFLLYAVCSLVVRAGLAKVPERLGLKRTGTAALVFIVGASAIAASWATAPALYLATVVMSAGGGFLYPSLMAIVVSRSRETERSQVMASFTMFFEVGAVVGGLVMGPVVSLAGERAGFLGGAVSGVVGLIVLRRAV